MTASGRPLKVGELPLRVTVGLFPYDRWAGVDQLIDAVAHADRLGYYAVGFPEHLVWPVTTGASPISVVWYDNFVLGATVAAATSRIRLLFNACVVPYRHPVELAKLVATLDVVSRGRVVLVAGTGWMRREFRILGIPFDERGPRTDDALRAMKTLWTQPDPSYEGRYFSIPPVHFFPRCVQQPHVPIWIGGNGPRPTRRAVELGDGWSPLGGSIDEVTASIARLRERLEAAGRDPAAFTFGCMLPFGDPDPASGAALEHLHPDRGGGQASSDVNQTVDMIGRFLAAGANHFQLQFGWSDPAQFKDVLERFSSDVMGQLGPPPT